MVEIEDPDGELRRALEPLRMEELANLKFKKCSLGMKHRIGIAMALPGDPALLILHEPINGLDTDGMRIMREILLDITRKYGCTVLGSPLMNVILCEAGGPCYPSGWGCQQSDFEKDRSGLIHTHTLNRAFRAVLFCGGC
jgi:hypothetical protein